METEGLTRVHSRSLCGRGHWPVYRHSPEVLFGEANSPLICCYRAKALGGGASACGKMLHTSILATREYAPRKDRRRRNTSYWYILSPISSSPAPSSIWWWMKRLSLQIGTFLRRVSSRLDLAVSLQRSPDEWDLR